uniref:Aminoglycoside phosphotransferase domain-containing protein n=1 Tax=Mucochytrium quahogii TaxID=96639 RepID=A0A7S2RHV3_9STRA|mmetsp:Transcript_9376/g.15293  ORF Transcript_9376/g.15293 Transcript_9376/m.15293 type:complete len:370 (-) Transcript_9376:309-1418(-)
MARDPTGRLGCSKPSLRPNNNLLGDKAVSKSNVESGINSASGERRTLSHWFELRTMCAADAHDKPESEVRELLRLILDGEQGPDDFELQKLTGGRAHAVYKVENGKTTAVLRVLEGHGAVETALLEQGVTLFLRQHNYPVPAIYKYKVVKGGSTALFLNEFCHGGTLGDLAQQIATKKGTVKELVPITKSFGATLASLHMIPDSKDCLEKHKVAMRTEDILPARGTPPSKGGISELFMLLVELCKDSPKSLLHMDFHAGNVIIDGDHCKSVLDWESCAYGDPRLDFAMAWGFLEMTPPEMFLGQENKNVIIQAFVSGYFQVLGQTYSDMSAFKAWALWALGQDHGEECAKRLKPAVESLMRQAGLGTRV